MTPQEAEHHIHQNKLRQEAIDREVLRLKNINKKQSSKISNLRKSLYFLLFFFISLFTIFLLKGMINFSGSESKSENLKLLKQVQQQNIIQTSLQDSITFYKNKYKEIVDHNINTRNESGIRYKVQIGAFKKINLQNFEENLVTINQEKYDSINQYTLGDFKDYEKAKEFNEIIKNMGFKDAFIASTKDGKRVPIESVVNK